MTTVAAPSRLATRNPFVLLHLLSLDAPIVAALWTWFLARTLGVPMRFFGPLAMFLAVWILYALDRLLDSRPTPQRAPLEARHLFHAAHRPLFSAAILLALAALILILPRAHSFLAERALFFVLAALLALWLTLVHTAGRPLPKEFAVGLFFAAACALPSVPAGLRLLAPALAYTAVCILNGLFIHAWEAPASANHPWTTAALRHLRRLALVAAILPLAVAPWLHTFPALLAASLAALAMLALDRARATLNRTTLRALADFTLLTPILVLLLLR